jgi:VIT1/CCC1 family predicted Fe2+/Mn2+ transporter
MSNPQTDPASDSQTPGHTHRDVSGGWLRPTIFGAMDGLVTNTSLIAGVAGAHPDRHTLIITGFAGLVAGAFSMSAGEWVSVRSQNHMVAAEMAKEERELLLNAEAEAAELAEVFRGHGLTEATAYAAAHEIARDPKVALRFHAREELGIDPDSLPSPLTAAFSSLTAFAIGAFVPLFPLLFQISGAALLLLPLIAAAVTAFAGGFVLARITDRSKFISGLEQLALALAATGITFLIGRLIGHAVG